MNVHPVKVHGRDIRRSSDAAWPLRGDDGRTFADKGCGPMKALGVTDWRNGRPVYEYVTIWPSRGRYYVNGICEGNRQGFAKLRAAVDYARDTWPGLPVYASLKAGCPRRRLISESSL